MYAFLRFYFNEINLLMQFEQQLNLKWRPGAHSGGWEG